MLGGGGGGRKAEMAKKACLILGLIRPVPTPDLGPNRIVFISMLW